MNRASIAFVLSAMLLAASVATLNADVRADEKAKVEFAGMLGRIVNIFGGKAARDGITTSIAVKGDRKASLNDQTGQIIDLGEEKIYDLDLKKKTYKVTTFEELRRRMEEARKKAEEDARKEAGKEKEKPAEPSAKEKEKEMEIDVDVKNTGAKKTINGFDTREMIVTITVREKGKTIEQSGGLIMTTDSWLAPKIAAMKEITDFDVRYAQKLYGSMIAGVSAEQMAAAMAMYPMLKQALGRMTTEGNKIDGTPIQTTATLDAVKSAEQIAEEQKTAEKDKPSAAGGVGGLMGGFAKKIAAKKMGGDDANKPRATFLTINNEVLKVVDRCDTGRRGGARGVQREQIGRVWQVGRVGRHMIKEAALVFIALSAVALSAQAPAKKKPAESAAARAARVHKEAIVVDTHIDTTMMLGREGWDFMVRHEPKLGRGQQPRRPAAHQGRRARRRLLFDLHARHDHRSRGGEAFADPDRPRPQPRREAPERDRAGDDGGRGAGGAQGGEVRGADGDGRRSHDRRQPRSPARLSTSRRPLPDAVAQRQHQLERFVRRYAEAQRPHRLRQGRRPRAEPARDVGGHLARLGQDILGRAGDEQGAAGRIALVAAVDLRPPAQHDRRHDPRPRRQGRRDHDQLLAQLPLRRAVPGRD